jgi:fatty-acyl-CoA synthase
LGQLVSLDEATLLDWSRERLAGYKRPRSCFFVRDDAIPRNALGKVLHRVLKAGLAEEASRTIGAAP